MLYDQLTAHRLANGAGLLYLNFDFADMCMRTSMVSATAGFFDVDWIASQFGFMGERRRSLRSVLSSRLHGLLSV